MLDSIVRPANRAAGRFLSVAPNRRDYQYAIRPIRETAARQAAPASARFRDASPCSRTDAPKNNQRWPAVVARKRLFAGPALLTAVHSCPIGAGNSEQTQPYA